MQEQLQIITWSPAAETSVLLSAQKIPHGFVGIRGNEQNSIHATTSHHVKQVHGRKVVKISELSSPNSSNRVEADGLYSTFKHKIAVKTADCLPVLVASTDGKFVAAIHAGWRGFTQGIILEGLETFKRFANTDNLIIAIGPAISQEAFEVGPEVVVALQMDTCGLKESEAWKIVAARGKSDRWLVDLQKAAALQLILAGIEPKNIEIIQSCTFSAKGPSKYLWNSYRREGKVAASNWSWIMNSN